jgi:hypothetical protein
LSDKHFASVGLLLGFAGSDGSSTFADEGPTGHTVTANGNAQIDTAQFTFGASSGLFDGNGDFLTAPDHADWDAGQSAVHHRGLRALRGPQHRGARLLPPGPVQ